MTINLRMPPVTRSTPELVLLHKWLLEIQKALQDIQDSVTIVEGNNSDDQSKYMLNWVTAPLTSTSSGTAGQMAYDSYYLYVCTDTDVWRRIAFETTAWGYLEDMDGVPLEFVDGTKIETH